MAKIPIIIYNIPGRSIIDMSVETMADLSKLDYIVGVKDATAQLDRPILTTLACGKDFLAVVRWRWDSSTSFG